MLSGKTIFISPLDWGLGHATRCVSVIRTLQKTNNNIILGITPLTSPVFDEAFPNLEKINLPAYNIKYSSVLPLWLKLLLDWKRISGVIRREKKVLDEIVLKYKVDVVISDNRFGLYSKKAYNIFMTHQVFLKTPFGATLLQNFNKKHILNFDEVWIPDFEDEENSLSGGLSHGKHFHPKIIYIGPQSRLEKQEPVKKKYDYLILISGPEPQSTILKNLLMKKCAAHAKLNFAVVSISAQSMILENVDYFISPNNKNLSKIINESANVICRSGYSTLMDMHALGKNHLILIPTPGQTEQEYLAKYWKIKFQTRLLLQRELTTFILQNNN